MTGPSLAFRRFGPNARLTDWEFAAAGFATAMGVGAMVLAMLANRSVGAWAVDGARNLTAAHNLLDGASIYTDPSYLYPPLAAALTAPILLLPVPLVVWALFKLALLASSTVRFLDGGLLAAVTAVTFLPVFQDTALGNFNVVIVVALTLVATREDRVLTGLPLGVAVAALPKPIILCFLLWMAVWRRKALLGAAGAAITSTGIAIAVAGPDQYGAWIATLRRAPETFSGGVPGDVGFTTSLPWAAPAIAALAGVILVLAVWRLDQDASLTIALSAPMLMVPYLGLYSAVPLVLAAWSIRRMERAVLPPLVLVAQPLALLFLPALAMLVMASGIALGLRRKSAPIEGRDVARELAIRAAITAPPPRALAPAMAGQSAAVERSTRATGDRP